MKNFCQTNILKNREQARENDRFTLIELLVKCSHLCCDREKPAHGQGKARFTLPMGRVKHALPLLSFSLS